MGRTCRSQRRPSVAFSSQIPIPAVLLFPRISFALLLCAALLSYPRIASPLHPQQRSFNFLTPSDTPLLVRPKEVSLDYNLVQTSPLFYPGHLAIILSASLAYYPSSTYLFVAECASSNISLETFSATSCALPPIDTDVPPHHWTGHGNDYQTWWVYREKAKVAAPAGAARKV